jgi:hypothetical protein
LLYRYFPWYINTLLTCCHGNRGDDSIFPLYIFIAMSHTFASKNSLKRMKFPNFWCNYHNFLWHALWVRLLLKMHFFPFDYIVQRKCITNCVNKFCPLCLHAPFNDDKRVPFYFWNVKIRVHVPSIYLSIFYISCCKTHVKANPLSSNKYIANQYHDFPSGLLMTMPIIRLKVFL